MFNFIIYEDEPIFRDKYFSVIEKFIGNSNMAYEIIEISKYTKEESMRLKNLSGNNIYILDIEDNEVHAEFVNTFSGIIDLSRLNEIGYSTKGETHGMGLPLVNKITRQNKRFACGPKIMNNFFIQHLIIKIFNKENLQKISKN